MSFGGVNEIVLCARQNGPTVSQQRTAVDPGRWEPCEKFNDVWISRDSDNNTLSNSRNFNRFCLSYADDALKTSYHAIISSYDDKLIAVSNVFGLLMNTTFLFSFVFPRYACAAVAVAFVWVTRLRRINDDIYGVRTATVCPYDGIHAFCMANAQTGLAASWIFCTIIYINGCICHHKIWEHLRQMNDSPSANGTTNNFSTHKLKCYEMKNRRVKKSIYIFVWLYACHFVTETW